MKTNTILDYNVLRDYSEQNPTEILEFIDYYSSGSVYEHLFYKNGNMHGRYRSYYNNSRLLEETMYKDGNKHGKTTNWNYDGTIVEQYFHLNGLKHGEYKCYDSDGSVKQHYFYIEGVEQPQLQYLTIERDEITLSLLFGDYYIK